MQERERRGQREITKEMHVYAHCAQYFPSVTGE